MGDADGLGLEWVQGKGQVRRRFLGFSAAGGLVSRGYQEGIEMAMRSNFPFPECGLAGMDP